MFSSKLLPNLVLYSVYKSKTTQHQNVADRLMFRKTVNFHPLIAVQLHLHKA
jgi:hypothetical protein